MSAGEDTGKALAQAVFLIGIDKQYIDCRMCQGYQQYGCFTDL